MSSNAGETLRISLSQRPRHQITRSISELSSPIRLNHHNSLHGERHRYRHREKESERDERSLAPRSAASSLNPLSRASNEFSRSEGVTPNSSRRTSILIAPGDDAVAGMSPSVMASTAPSVQLPREEEAHNQLRRISTREKNALNTVLVNLAEESHTTSHHLDQVYYSMLTRLSMLQTTVAALSELARDSHELNVGFERDARLFERDAYTQLDALGHFDVQQARIQELQARVHGGRDRVQTLDACVDAVCRRVEGWEAADRAWQERTRRRLRTVWVVTLVVVLLFVLLAFSAQYTPGGSGAGGGLDEGQDGVGKSPNESVGLLGYITSPGLADSVWGLTRESGDETPDRKGLVWTTNETTEHSSVKMDETLRRLEEL